MATRSPNACRNKRGDGRRQRDLGHEHQQHAPAGREHLRREPQVDLGLAAAGHAVEQRDAERSPVARASGSARQRLCLLRRQTSRSRSDWPSGQATQPRTDRDRPARAGTADQPVRARAARRVRRDAAARELRRGDTGRRSPARISSDRALLRAVATRQAVALRPNPRRTGQARRQPTSRPAAVIDSHTTSLVRIARDRRASSAEGRAVIASPAPPRSTPPVQRARATTSAGRNGCRVEHLRRS